MKDVILSFDYELFFGTQSGTVEKSLIEPTNLLLDSMDSNGLKGNFFVDWQMLKYLKEEGTERTDLDYLRIEEQLRDIVKRGHRIELHIHPHWVDAKYKGDGTWDFLNFKHYSLDSFTEEEIVSMFNEGVDLLTKIARKEDADYRIVAFRAGGWAVQPFEKLKHGLKSANITIDSSCAYWQYYTSKYSTFDFRSEVLKDADLYSFSADVLQPEKNGEFIEVPISTFKRGWFHRVVDKSYDIFVGKRKRITDGSHKRPDLPPFGRRTITMMSLSGRSPLSILLSIISSKHQLITMIDHPKDYSMSNQSSIKMIAKCAKSTTYYELCGNINKKSCKDE